MSFFVMVAGGPADSAKFDGASVALATTTFTRTPTATRDFQYEVSGPGGTATCDVTVTVQAAPTAPTCIATANKTTITQGEWVTITLAISGDATSAEIQGTSVALSNPTRDIRPPDSRTARGRVTGPGGSSTCEVFITVQPIPPPTCTLTANPTTIVEGQGTTLQVTVSGQADQVKIEQFDVTGTNSRYFTPPVTKTFTAEVANAGGTNTCTRLVTVNPANPAITAKFWRFMVNRISTGYNNTSAHIQELQLQFNRSTWAISQVANVQVNSATFYINGTGHAAALSASSETNQFSKAAAAFDNSNSTWWRSNGGYNSTTGNPQGPAQWVRVSFSTAKAVTGYRMEGTQATVCTYCPVAVTVQYSNNGSSWTQINDATGVGNSYPNPIEKTW